MSSLTIPGVPVSERQHSRLLQSPLAARRGVPHAYTRAAGLSDERGRPLWGRLGRQVDPTGVRKDRRPIIDINEVRAAVTDTSRHIQMDVAAIGDSLRLVERRALQVVQRADALDRALSRERVEVQLDTLALELRVGSAAAGREGVRPASVNVVAPPSASVRLGRVEEAPEVCGIRGANSTSGQWASVRRLVERVCVSVGYSALRAPAGTVVPGVGVGLGVRIWP